MLNIKKITALTLSVLSLGSNLFCNKSLARELFRNESLERTFFVLNPKNLFVEIQNEFIKDIKDYRKTQEILNVKYGFSKTQATKANIINGFNEQIKQSLKVNSINLENNILQRMYQFLESRNMVLDIRTPIYIGDIRQVTYGCLIGFCSTVLRRLNTEENFYNSVPISYIIYGCGAYLFLLSNKNPKVLDKLFENAFPNKEDNQLVSKNEILEYFNTKIAEAVAH